MQANAEEKVCGDWIALRIVLWWVVGSSSMAVDRQNLYHFRVQENY
jgi:hypothetical protein